MKPLIDTAVQTTIGHADCKKRVLRRAHVTVNNALFKAGVECLIVPGQDERGLLLYIGPATPKDAVEITSVVRAKFGRSYGPVRIFIAEARS